MRVQLRRRIVVAVVVVVVISAIVYGFWPAPLLVDSAPATRGMLRVTVEEEGKTRLRDRYVVSAPVAGTTRRVVLHVGDTLKRGQVVVEIDPARSGILDPRSRAEAQAREAGAEAALRAARANAVAAVAAADFAVAEAARLQRLFEHGDVTRGALDQAEAAARSARANQSSAEFGVDVARHELEAARTALRYSGASAQSPGAVVQVRSPVDGQVLKLIQESEAAVPSGQPLLEVGDTRALEVEVDVLSADAVRIGPGTPVLFERWGGEGVLSGKVRRVEPVGFTKVSALGVEEQRVLVIADIDTPRDRWPRLGDGYRLDATFILWEGTDVLQIPANALFRFQDGWAVFALDGSRADRRPVVVGQRNGLVAQIVEGLKEGEVVITHPPSELTNGGRVRARKAG